jgi:hypothetical protein
MLSQLRGAAADQMTQENNPIFPQDAATNGMKAYSDSSTTFGSMIKEPSPIPIRHAQSPDKEKACRRQCPKTE